MKIENITQIVKYKKTGNTYAKEKDGLLKRTNIETLSKFLLLNSETFRITRNLVSTTFKK